MSQDKRKSLVNIRSKLLTESDHKILFDLFKERCLTLATSVVQLVHAPGPQFNRWVKQSCGVLTFIKDNPQRSYFIRLYDLKGRRMLFEQELYNNFAFNKLTEKFFYFDGNDCPIGLNFSDQNEAKEFHRAVNEKMVAKHKRKSNMEVRKSVTPSMNAQTSANTTNSHTAPTPAINSNSAVHHSNINNNNVGNRVNPVKSNMDASGDKKVKVKKNKKKPKISKNEIGMPTDFVQLQHFGVDGISGSNERMKADEQSDLIDRYWSILQSSGFSREKIASDVLTRQFIINFIYENKEKFDEELREKKLQAQLAGETSQAKSTTNQAPPSYSNRNSKRIAPVSSSQVPPPPGRKLTASNSIRHAPPSPLPPTTAPAAPTSHSSPATTCYTPSSTSAPLATFPTSYLPFAPILIQPLPTTNLSPAPYPTFHLPPLRYIHHFRPPGCHHDSFLFHYHLQITLNS